jgi:hypothetical protein
VVADDPFGDVLVRVQADHDVETPSTGHTAAARADEYRCPYRAGDRYDSESAHENDCQLK